LNVWFRSQRKSPRNTQTKGGGKIKDCACAIRLDARAAVATASTKRLVNVTGLAIDCLIDPAADDRLVCDGLLIKLRVDLTASSVASAMSLLRSAPARRRGAAS
jgi:hypothetical protein